MMVPIGNEPRRRVRRLALRWTSRVFFLAGVSLLAWSAFVLVDAREFQKRENRLLDGKLRQIGLAVPPPETGAPMPVPARSLIGRLGIPRLGLSQVVIEGSDSKTLRRSVGHVAGTPLPGQPGNAVITGHRDTFFRPLRNIRQGDRITFTSPQGNYLYSVVSIGVLNPGDVEVLDSSGGSGRRVLTLVTCYPFYFVGAAPGRFVVRAEWVSGLN